MSATLHGVDPRTGRPGPELAESTADELDAVIAAAAQAARDPRLADAARRAAMLRGAADPPARSQGRDRRAGKQRDRAARGPTGRRARAHRGAARDAGRRHRGGRPPGGHHRPRRRRRRAGRLRLPAPTCAGCSSPIGPVAVFGASNFPLAFSTAGGDTASALAAGCPVVVKGHPAHPRTGSLVAEQLSAAAADAGLPAGTFGHVLEAGFGLAERLVRDDRIEAVAFTGSLRGGPGHQPARGRAPAADPGLRRDGQPQPGDRHRDGAARPRRRHRRRPRGLGRHLRRPAVHQARDRVVPGRRARRGVLRAGGRAPGRGRAAGPADQGHRRRLCHRPGRGRRGAGRDPTERCAGPPTATLRSPPGYPPPTAPRPAPCAPTPCARSTSGPR